MDVQKIIDEQVKTHPVVLYMKGSPSMPRCGFSATAVQILQACGAKEIFAVDVLADRTVACRYEGRWGAAGGVLFTLVTAVRA